MEDPFSQIRSHIAKPVFYKIFLLISTDTMMIICNKQYTLIIVYIILCLLVHGYGYIIVPVLICNSVYNKINSFQVRYHMDDCTI